METTNMSAVSSSSLPTTSDVSLFMRDIGYTWSNEAQIYYKKYPARYPINKVAGSVQTINRSTAEHLYLCILGTETTYREYAKNPCGHPTNNY